jgi:hypothetical protein
MLDASITATLSLCVSFPRQSAGKSLTHSRRKSFAAFVHYAEIHQACAAAETFAHQPAGVKCAAATRRQSRVNVEKKTASSRDSLPPFNWRRTLLLLAVSWLVGTLWMFYIAPEQAWWANVLIGLVVGVLTVGVFVRIF